MKKGAIYVALTLVLCMISGCIGKTKYEMVDTPSNLEIHGLTGVVLTVEADDKSAKIQVKNGADHYVVVDFSRLPIWVEKNMGDGWYRILGNGAVRMDSLAISENQIERMSFSWKQLLGSSLDPGTYRMILFYGDGTSEIFAYNTATEFVIE